MQVDTGMMKKGMFCKRNSHARHAQWVLTIKQKKELNRK